MLSPADACHLRACDKNVPEFRPEFLAASRLASGLSFIGGRAIEGRYCGFIQPQVHGQLSAVVGQMAEDGVGDHDVTSAFREHAIAGDQPPAIEQVLLVRAFQCALRLGGAIGQ